MTPMRECKKCQRQFILNENNFRRSKGYWSNTCRHCTNSQQRASRNFKRENRIFGRYMEPKPSVEMLKLKHEKVFKLLKDHDINCKSLQAAAVDTILKEVELRELK